jgi:hypothetical protein
MAMMAGQSLQDRFAGGPASMVASAVLCCAQQLAGTLKAQHLLCCRSGVVLVLAAAAAAARGSSCFSRRSWNGSQLSTDKSSTTTHTWLEAAGVFLSPAAAAHSVHVSCVITACTSSTLCCGTVTTVGLFGVLQPHYAVSYGC